MSYLYAAIAPKKRLICVQSTRLDRFEKQILLCSSDLRFNKIKDIDPKSLRHLTQLNTL